MRAKLFWSWLIICDLKFSRGVITKSVEVMHLGSSPLFLSRLNFVLISSISRLKVLQHIYYLVRLELRLGLNFQVISRLQATSRNLLCITSIEIGDGQRDKIYVEKKVSPLFNYFPKKRLSLFSFCSWQHCSLSLCVLQLLWCFGWCFCMFSELLFMNRSRTWGLGVGPSDHETALFVCYGALSSTPFKNKLSLNSQALRPDF